ncbi:18382_t:CDS:1, partial [Racocetra persica]
MEPIYFDENIVPSEQDVIPNEQDILTEQYMISSEKDMTLSGVGNSIYTGTDVSAQSNMNPFMKHTSPVISAQSNMNPFMKHTSPVIFDTTSLNMNSIPDLSLSNTLPMYTNNPLNPNLSTPYEKYSAKTDFNTNNAFNDKIDFNVNNAFNNETSPNLPIVIPMYTNNPLNPNLSSPLYKQYLAKTDFNANNAFNDEIYFVNNAYNDEINFVNNAFNDKIDFNVNNAFNNQTSPNLPIVNTST